MDQTSEDYLASLVESLAGTPILLLTTYRPGYRPPWLDKSYATQLALRNLASHNALTVVHSIIQRERLPDHLSQTIIEKAEGNPFFLEELTRTIIEHGDVQADTMVPDTIQGVLSARIDRLPEASKRLLQTASVLGREFSARLLEAVWDGTASPAPLLLELKHLEFLFERAGGEEPLFVFKHALTQDVAYDSLLTTRRQTLHMAVAQALEVLYANRLDEAHDRLAYHYARTTEAAKAVDYLTRLAERAVGDSAHTEAVAAFAEALVHAQHLPDTERDQRVLDLIIGQANSLVYLGRSHDLIDLLVAQQERLERLQDPLLAGRYYLQLGRIYNWLGNREQAVNSLQYALGYAQESGDTLTLSRTHTWLALEYYWSGQPRQSIEHGRQAVSLLEGSEERERLGVAYYQLGLFYSGHGDFVLALGAAAQAADIGEAIANRPLQAYTAWITGRVYMLREEWQAHHHGRDNTDCELQFHLPCFGQR